MVLLQKQDDRLVLKFHGKNMASVVDTKHTFSPIIKLNTVLVRPVATGKNRRQVEMLSGSTTLSISIVQWFTPNKQRIPGWRSHRSH